MVYLKRLIGLWPACECQVIRMPYYAIAKGRQVGIVDSWSECKANVDGYSGARFKKFNSVAECQDFIAQNSSGSGSSSRGVSSSYRSSSYAQRFRPYSSRPEVTKDDYVDAWTDGACPGNGQNATAAGRGVFFGDNHPWNISERADGPPTNNRGEIQAALRAIQVAKKNGVTKLRINTDSDFVKKSVEQWMPRWKANGWKTSSKQEVKNKDDFMRLDAELDGSIDVQWKHVPGHKGVYGNEQADALARRGAAK